MTIVGNLCITLQCESKLFQLCDPILKLTIRLQTSGASNSKISGHCCFCWSFKLFIKILKLLCYLGTYYPYDESFDDFFDKSFYKFFDVVFDKFFEKKFSRNLKNVFDEFLDKFFDAFFDKVFDKFFRQIFLTKTFWRIFWRRFDDFFWRTNLTILLTNVFDEIIWQTILIIFLTIFLANLWQFFLTNIFDKVFDKVFSSSEDFFGL